MVQDHLALSRTAGFSVSKNQGQSPSPAHGTSGARSRVAASYFFGIPTSSLVGNDAASNRERFTSSARAPAPTGSAQPAQPRKEPPRTDPHPARRPPARPPAPTPPKSTPRVGPKQPITVGQNNLSFSRTRDGRGLPTPGWRRTPPRRCYRNTSPLCPWTGGSRGPCRPW